MFRNKYNLLEWEYPFLDSSQRHNSKTWYYLRLITYHPFALVVHNEHYKNHLLCHNFSTSCKRDKTIFNIQNHNDMYNLSNLIFKGSIKGWISDNQLTMDYYLSHYNCDYHFFYLSDLNLGISNKLTDDKIREIILTDMALGKKYYES